MSAVEDILTILTSYHAGYRVLRARMGSYTGPMPGEERRHSPPVAYDDAVIHATLSRMKRNNLVEHHNHIWNITKKGMAFLAKQKAIRRHKQYRIPKSAERNMIIAFDIPERQKVMRNWLRVELVNLGFTMLQKSVWFGPAPLPSIFVSSLQKTRLLSHMKFFEVKESQIA